MTVCGSVWKYEQVSRMKYEYEMLAWLQICENIDDVVPITQLIQQSEYLNSSELFDFCPLSYFTFVLQAQDLSKDVPILFPCCSLFFHKN